MFRVMHVVTQPREPFRTSDGALEIHQIPAWKDNLIWVAMCTQTREAAVIDGPEAGPLLEYCTQNDIQLTTILNTHTHPDHIGVNRDLDKRGRLAALTVYGPALDADRVPGLTRPVSEGDSVRVGAVDGRVLLTEGHIDGHVSYVFDDVLFCGDTLFGAGCGYLFDGPPAKMHAALSRLAELEGSTRVCCAHEYTEDNLRFAWSIDGENPRLAERIRTVWALRARGECSIPSTIEEERATNPFMRGAALAERVGQAMPDASMSTPAEIFAATRALKDRKLYRGQDDATLPL